MTRKRSCIMAIFIAMIFIITSFLCINTSLLMASAATYLDSGRYKFDFDIGLSILDGGTPTGYFRAYIYGNSTSSSTTTIPNGAVLKFSPKKLEIVIPKGSSSSYHQFYGRVYDVKITGPVSFSSPNVNNGSVSKNTTLTYNLSGLTLVIILSVLLKMITITVTRRLAERHLITEIKSRRHFHSR